MAHPKDSVENFSEILIQCSLLQMEEAEKLNKDRISIHVEARAENQTNTF